jgi:murein DD-endopeptidase MepM/ murein hydrolase activator NlpD
MDLVAPMGSTIMSAHDGHVSYIGWLGPYGRAIEVTSEDGRVMTRYGHLRSYAAGLHVGQQVSQGSTLGQVGVSGVSTGPHLHFEVYVDGQHKNPAPFVGLRCR